MNDEHHAPNMNSIDFVLKLQFNLLPAFFRSPHFRYYADLEKKRCPELNIVSNNMTPNDSQNLAATDHNACYVWRRFAK